MRNANDSKCILKKFRLRSRVWWWWWTIRQRQIEYVRERWFHSISDSIDLRIEFEIQFQSYDTWTYHVAYHMSVAFCFRLACLFPHCPFSWVMVKPSYPSASSWPSQITSTAIQDKRWVWFEIRNDSTHPWHRRGWSVIEEHRRRVRSGKKATKKCQHRTPAISEHALSQ